MNAPCRLCLLFLSGVSMLHGITFDEWKAQVFTPSEVLNASVSGEMADPDRDGMVNLLEYALGADPKTADAGLLPRSPSERTLTFRRRKDTIDLDFVVEVSADLATWSNGFASAWTTDVTEGATVDVVTATSQTPAGTRPREFMRLKVMRSPRAALLASLNNAGNSPSQMIAQSVVPSGTYVGAISRYPVRPAYLDPNYVTQWYLANIGLRAFIPTHKDLVKAFMDRYLAVVDPTRHRIDDTDLYSSDWSLFGVVASDSDDAYAGTFLLLASEFQKAYPTDSWFQTNKAKLKDIAYYNLALQVKDTYVDGKHDTLVRVLQDYSGSRKNDTGYLMDNVQAWAGLAAFVSALQRIGDIQADIDYYAAWRDTILTAIHEVLWDSVNNAWRASDIPLGNGTLPPAAGSVFYPDLQCQYYPELYGLPYPGSTVETQRRYNMAWKWVIDHMPAWWTSAAWPTADQFSHVDIAIVAARHGEYQHVGDFLTMASQRWLPNATFWHGTVSSDVGNWQALIGH